MLKYSIKNINFLDTLFIRWYFVIYYLYMMSVNVVFAKGGIYGAIMNIFFLAFLTTTTIKRERYCRQFRFIYIYILFYFVLILLQSSNYLYSYTILIKYSLGLLCLPLGFSIISTVHKFRELLKTGLILVVIYVIYIAIANIFNFGDFHGYKVEGALQIGNVFADGLYTNVYVITSIFLILAMFPKHRWKIVVLLAICALITIVNMKRTVIAVLAIGLVGFVGLVHINSRKLQRNLISKYLKVLLIALFCTTPFFAGYFYTNYNERNSSFDEDYEMKNEGRVTEFYLIVDEIFNSNDITTILFGKETFNIVGTYAGGRYGNRPIHNDYAKIIHGSGVVGMLFWLCMLLLFVFKMLRISKDIRYKNNTLHLYLFALYFSFFIIYMISMFSGVIGIVLSSSYFFAMMGAILRQFYNKKAEMFRRANQ